MDKQLYLPILEEVHKVYTSYFEQAKDNSNIFIDEAEQYVRQLYHNSCLDYYGASPPEILNINVFGWDISQDMERAWWFHKKFDIKLNRFYLSNDDWEKIVIKQEHDSLLRAEASDELWLKWKHQFLLFDEHQNHIYSIFDKEKAASGYIYLIKQLGESLYKIGYTKNSDIKKRLSQLQTGNPHDLEIIGYFKCAGKTTEKTLHSLFLAQCKTGEWYSLSQNDVNNILDQNWRRENNIF